MRSKKAGGEEGASLGQGSQVALGALVVSPFHVSVRNRGVTVSANYRRWANPQHGCLHCVLLLQSPSRPQNSETHPNMGVFTWESQCV